MCMICGNTEKETRHIPLYVRGSEGLSVCHDCEMLIVEIVRDLIRYNWALSKKIPKTIVVSDSDDEDDEPVSLAEPDEMPTHYQSEDGTWHDELEE